VAQAGFWNLPEEERNQVIGEMKEIKRLVEPLTNIGQQIEDMRILFELACEESDADAFNEVQQNLVRCEQDLVSLRLKATFTAEDDPRNAFLSIQAGAGGTDACDWASMLLRMYTRYAENRGYKTTLLDLQHEEEGGIKSATLQIQGKLAYGYLKSENGVHRLVRISPFDASGRRHTSFAAVHLVPEIADVNIDFNEKDLKIDFYRSSGPGGQNVNTTDSAVRLTHLPSGIVVCCQNERSQHKNRAMAMKVLQARIYQKSLDERQEKIAKQYGNKASVSWSNQIRSYVLQPYTLVKDHRTNFEVGNVAAVLDGEIEPFIEAYLLLLANPAKK
jgi:peptide chain release factor 2